MSTSNPTPSLRQVIAEIKQYLSLQCEWVKLDSVEKLTRIVSSLIFLILAIILIAIALLYLSLSVVHIIQIYTGAVAAYSIMAGFFLLLFVVLWLLRRSCIVNPILRFFYKMFLTPKEGQNDFTSNTNNEL